MARTSLSLLLLAVCLAVACQRVEEPRAGADAPMLGETAPQKRSFERPPEPAAPSRSPTRCIAPWPDAPQPMARAATHCPTSPEPAPRLTTGAITFLEAPGQPTVSVELTRTPSERARGLMYRTQLDQDSGMLFSWENEEQRTFWMHNTCIPLDMLFLAADATIVGILEQVPTLNDDARSVGCPAAHVLELNAGWSRAHGVRPGQKVRIAR
ncbi:MAG: DUF192 domain-containing protein [Polyangiaceae bacterium]|nr:DUF192 domain-containing protein [Polyangiaceae bacterium]